MAFLQLLVVFGLISTARCWDNIGRSLAATCTLPDFEVLKPTITQAPVLDLEWVGANDLTVFAITKQYASDAGGLWRSTDGGANFKELTANLTASVNSTDKFRITGIYSQKSSPRNLLVMGSGKYMWTSNDSGESFTAIATKDGWLGRNIRSAKVHPLKDNWLLVLVQRPNCKSLDKAQTECPYDLMLSKDMFSSEYSFINLTANANGGIAGFVDFDWGASLCPKGNCTDPSQSAEQQGQAIPDELIMATMYARPGDYDQPWDKDVHFVTSTDVFATFSTRVRCGNMFEVVGRSVYLAVANSCPTAPDGRPGSGSRYPQGITLYTSMDAGNTFTRACLPVALNQDGYELVETHDGRGAVVIVEFEVDTGYLSLPAASVYTAGPHHALFSLSLTNLYNQKFGTTADFARVEGLPGIYIANQMLPWGYDDGGGSSEPLSDASIYDAAYEYDLDDLTEVPLVETRITFNGGGRWQRIPTPKSFTNPVCDRCKGVQSCFLHLNGLSAWDNMGFSLPAVYSNPSAPGLVIATGNVAPQGLGLDPDAGVCTWLSRDGGVTWTDVGEGAYIYEFADWGGVVVMARHPGLEGSGANAVATELRFSMDYGSCWQSVHLDIPLLVDNIRIEPDGQRAVVIVHGRACKKTTIEDCGKANTTDGLMYALNVDELMRNKGKTGTCTDEDFEEWTVSRLNDTSRCVLGEQMKLQRRKQDSACFQGGEYVRPAPTRTPCNCTLEVDSECEYGFIRSNNTCKRIPESSMPVCPVIDSGTYTVSEKGRRLVHGDQCLNAKEMFPDTDGAGKANSRGRRGESHSSGWVVMLVLLLLLGVVVGAGGAWYRFKASDEQRETVRELAASALAGLAALWGLLVDNISALINRRRGGAHSGGGGEEMGYFQPLGDPGYDVEGRGNVFTLR